MSMGSVARAIGDDLRAASDADRAEWKAIIKALFRLGRRAYRTLPSTLLLNIGSGLMELVIKAKAGFNVEKMLGKARAADPDVSQIVSELQQEIEHESRTEAENGARLELGSGQQAIAYQGGGAGPGNGAAAGPAETEPWLAPGIPAIPPRRR
jgi:hypothetical protein